MSAAANTVKRGSNASTGSQGSRSASKSRSNVSVSSIKSTLSNLSRRSGLSFSLGSRRSSAPLPQDIVWKEGDHGETVSLVTMRQDEALESDCVTELPIGTFCQVIQVGEGRRLKVKAGQFEGWISCRTRLDEPLLDIRKKELQSSVEDFEVGGQHEVKSAVTVRAAEALDSAVLTELRPGNLLRILEIGVTNRRRAKIATDMGCEGWISMATKNGELLIGKVSEVKKETTFFSNSSKTKAVLEAARSGDLSEIQKIVDKRESLVSRFQSRVSLNCSDIRGKTPLIYAAAFGHLPVVTYLVGKPEVDVNAMDDTQKSALHHAAKRAAPRTTKEKDGFEDGQSEIIGMLIRAKAYLESRDHNGCTALMFAVANGDESVVMKLLAARVNLNVKDFEGHTPLDYAINFGHCDLAKTLRVHGAETGEDENIPSVEGVVVDSFIFSIPQEGAETAAPKRPSLAGTNLSSGATSTSLSVAATSPKAKKVTRKRLSNKEELSQDGTDVIQSPPQSPDASGYPDGQETKAASPKKGSKKAGAKKAAGKSKSKAKEKHLGAGMQEMLDAHQGRASVVAGGEIAVEVEAKEEVIDEKEQVRTRALQKLKAILESGSSIKELQSAIDAAAKAGVDQKEVDEAKQSLKLLKERAAARDDLMNAVTVKDVDLLRAAIAKAGKTGVGEDEIKQARTVLAAEEPRAEARKKLEAAEKAADVEALKTAISEAKKVALPDEEISYFQELLAGAESKEKAQEMLREAVESCDVSALKFAIQQAKDLGVSTSEAEAVLKVEEPKQQAREMLADACKECTIVALKEAVSNAKRAGLAEAEYEEAVELLAREEEKEKLLANVKQAILESKDVDTTSMDALRVEKDKISKAIKEAKEAGVPEALLADAELRRRRIHNGIEDLKGSIRVFCRVRPLAKFEEANGDVNCVKAGSDGMSLEVEGSSFSFDAVFLPGTQQELFEECRDLVQSAVDGYNVTMFAYGQTGAGKTFTMYGAPGQEGTSPRTIAEIFKVIDAGRDRYTYTVMCSMLELYRNNLRDLLVGADGKSAGKLNVKQDKQGMVFVEHLTEEECSSAEQLMEVLERGNKERTVASTAMNAESSRSHLVLMIKIVSVNKQTQDQLRGKILMCDLAGSERLKKSKVDAEMQQEAIEINKSLTALGDVIEGLTKGSKNVPYRNHKLTQLMQDAIGGSSKTLMFVNCSPASSNTDETLMSLKYATRAKMIKNSAKKIKGGTE